MTSVPVSVSGGGSSPASRAVAVTASNTVDFASPCRGLYVGTAGNVTAVVGGVAVLFTAVPAGMILPIQATRVNATGTTAGAMVALF